MSSDFDSKWQSQLQQVCSRRSSGKEKIAVVANSDCNSPPASPSLQDLIEEKTKVIAEHHRLLHSPQILFVHKDIPLSRVKKLEGTIDRLIQIQSQLPSPNSTLSPIDVKQSEGEECQAVGEKTVEYRQECQQSAASRQVQFYEENRRLESLLSESQRKIQELVARNSDLHERQEVLQGELRLTIKTLEQCRDFKLSCGKYVKDLEAEMQHLRREMRVGRSMHLEEILKSFAQRIELLEDPCDDKIEERLENLEDALKALVKEKKQLQSQLQEATRTISQLTAEKQTAEQQRKARDEKQAAEVHVLQQELARLRSQSEAHQSDQERIESLMTELSRLNAELQKAAIRCQKAELQLEEREREPVLEKAVAPADSQVTLLLLRKENEELSKDRKRLQATCEMLQGQSAKFSDELKAEKQKQEAAEKITAELAAKKADSDKLRAQLKKEEAVRKRLEAELLELKSQAATGMSKQSAEAEALAASVKSMKLQQKRSADKLQHMQSLREQLQDSLTAATGQVAQLQEQVSKLMDTVRERDRAIGKADRGLADLQRSALESQSKAQEYEIKLSEALAREVGLKQEIQKLWDQLSDLQRVEAEPDNPDVPVQEKMTKESSRESLELRVYFESWLETLPSSAPR